MPEYGSRPSRSKHQSTSSLKSGERIIRIFDLFAIDRPTITAAYVAERLEITPSTAYRYLALLRQVGLIERVASAGYTLGPAITEFDWQMRLSDRFLQTSRVSMRWLLEHAQPGAAVLLCRHFRGGVMSVHQEQNERFSGHLSYERGRLMPMFLGAPSKVILAHLPRRTARALFADPANRASILAGGFGLNCQEINANLSQMRRSGLSVTYGDLDPGRVGIASPIFNRGSVLGSIAVVLEERGTTKALTARTAALVRTAAADITAALD